MNEITHTREMLSKPGQYGSRWYALQSKPRQELKAAAKLEAQGFTVFCPVWTGDERTDEHKIRPLFTGYLFIFMEPGKDDFGVVKYTPGVLCWVMFGPEYGIISAAEIDKFKRLEQKNGIIPIGLEYKPGDEVIITTGAIKDNIGKVEERISRDEVIVAVPILGKKCLVRFEAREIEPNE